MRIVTSTRIGMGIAGAWLVGATTWLTYSDIRVARFLRNSAFEVCDYATYYSRHYEGCWSDLMRVATLIDHPLANLALVSLAPIVLLWLGADIGCGGSHGFRRGRARVLDA